MSNKKLKEQIEAAKIALVHSTEFDAPPTPRTVVTPTAIPVALQSVAVKTPLIDSSSALVANDAMQQQSADTMPKTDFTILETHIKNLEDQVQNQQRDLHILLQKLREITLKSKKASAPEKVKGKSKWFFWPSILCGGALVAYYMLSGGKSIVVANAYDIAASVVALIDALSSGL